MKEYFLKLFQYNAWANKRVLDGLKQQSAHDEKIRTLLGHVLAAQFIWLHRIKGLAPPPLKLWSDYSVDQLESMVIDSSKQWLEFLSAEGNFNRDLDYKNFAGEPCKNNVEMIMIHVANHGTYHRAQIAMLLRQKNFEPANTDFITYDRVIRGQLKD